LRFNGAGVIVGTAVGVDERGVNVSVTGTFVGAGCSGVGEAGSRAGAGIPQAEKVMINKPIDKILFRVCVDLIYRSFLWRKSPASHHKIMFICYNQRYCKTHENDIRILYIFTLG